MLIYLTLHTLFPSWQIKAFICFWVPLVEKGRSPKTSAKLEWDVFCYRAAQFETGVSASFFVSPFSTRSHHSFIEIKLLRWYQAKYYPPHALKDFTPHSLLVTYIAGYSIPFPSFRCAGMEQPHAAVQTGSHLAWEQLCRKEPGILLDTKWTRVSNAPFPTSYWAVARLKPASHRRDPSPLFSTGVATDGKLWPALGFQTQCRHWQSRLSSTEGYQGGWGLQHMT